MINKAKLNKKIVMKSWSHYSKSENKKFIVVNNLIIYSKGKANKEINIYDINGEKKWTIINSMIRKPFVSNNGKIVYGEPDAEYGGYGVYIHFYNGIKKELIGMPANSIALTDDSLYIAIVNREQYHGKLTNMIYVYNLEGNLVWSKPYKLQNTLFFNTKIENEVLIIESNNVNVHYDIYTGEEI